MTTKQLSIKVTLSDAATAGLRSLATSMVGFGRRVIGITNDVGAKIGGIARNLLSMKTLIAGVLGTLAGGAAFQSLRRAAAELDEIVKTSRQLGLSGQFLSELKYAADLSGVAFEGLSSSAAKAARNIDEIIRTGGKGKAADAFRELGVQIRGANGQARPFSDILLDLADGLGRVDSSYKRVAYSQAIFGKGGTEMLRLFALGRPAIQAMAEEARRLGVVFSDEQLANAEKFNDAITRIGKAWLGLRAGIIGRAGDEIADVMNRIASGIAAIPEIAGNIAGVFRQAFDVNSPEGRKMLDALAGLGQGIIGVFDAVAYGAVAVIAGGIVDGSRVLFAMIDDIAVGLGKRVAQSIGTQLAKAWESVGFHEMARMTREGLAWIDDHLGADVMLQSFRESFISSMNESGASTMALSLAVDNISEKIIRLGGDADALFGISEALSKTAVSAAAIPPRLREINEENENLKEGLKGLVVGFRDAFDAIREEAKNTASLGSEIAKTVTVDLSRGLSSAFIDGITKAKSFGDAVVNVMRDIARSVAQAITQFLILRAITGIAGSFAGAGVSLPAGGIGGSGSQGLPSFGGAAFANKGLTSARPNLSLSGATLAAITAAGVPAYASGTSSVPGPHTNRDVTLAMLTPREAVLTPRAADALGRDRIDHLNRGGSVGGGGMVFAPNITVNVQASPGTDGNQVGRDIGRNIAAELLKELSRNPGARAQFRSQLD